MKKQKYKAYVVKQFLSGQNGIGEPGIDEYEEIITVSDISFAKNGVDYVMDEEGNEYSFAEKTLMKVLEYTGIDDCMGVGIYDGDVFASVKYNSTELTNSKLRWEIYYKPSRMQYYARDKAEEIEKPLWEFLRSTDDYGLQGYRIVGNVVKNPQLTVVQ